METQETKEPLVKFQFGSRHYVALSRKKLWTTAGLLLLLSASAVALWQSGDTLDPLPAWFQPVGNIGLTLASAALGLILAPTPKPADYSSIAAVAVDEMAEASRSTGALIERLATIARLDELADADVAKVHLALIEQELARQQYVQAREIERWSRVAPGSEDEIVKGRETSASILQKLEREQGSGQET